MTWEPHAAICRECERPVRAKGLCEVHYRRDLRERNQDQIKVRDQKKNWNLEKNYGLTLDEFKKLEAEQNGTCLVCGSGPNGRYAQNLVVDHNHETGKIRGLLCDTCNRAIGLLGDDPELLEKAASYLRRMS